MITSTPTPRRSRRLALCLSAAALLACAAAAPSLAQPPKDLRRQDSPLTRDPCKLIPAK